MAKNNLPNSNKVYFQNNRTNVMPIGNLWSTFNVDLQSNLGVLRIFPRFRLAYSHANADQFGLPVAINYFDGKIMIIAGTYVWRNGGTPSDTSWTVDQDTGYQSDYDPDASDAKVFNNALCTTTEDGLFSKARNGSGTGAWTQRDVLTGGWNHVMVYFKRFDRLYYTDAIDQIISIDSSWVTADPGNDYAISLTQGSELDYMISSLAADTQNIWIGTINRMQMVGGIGKLLQWDGISAQITNEYPLKDAIGVMAVVVDPVHNNPFIMDSNGVLSEFNGTGFTELARLPFPPNKMPYHTYSNENDRFIHPNGMYFTRQGTLRMLINNKANDGSVIENMPSGVWEWSRDTGLVHLGPMTYTPGASTTITDFGQNMVDRVGALAGMQSPFASASEGTMMAGVSVYTNASATNAGIFFDNSNDNIQKKGYFVTDWFESKEVADSWDVWWSSFRRFLAATDQYVLKYRAFEEDAVVGGITWVDTTHFTVLNSAVDVSQFWTADTGGEVEILRGTGSGLCAHITNAVLVAGTWTVTIDEVATGVTTGTATARFQNWIKIFPALPITQENAWAQWAIGTDSEPRYQLKACFTYTGKGEYYKSILTSNEDIKSGK